jgi:hypothetical protein
MSLSGTYSGQKSLAISPNVANHSFHKIILPEVLPGCEHPFDAHAACRFRSTERLEKWEWIFYL